MENKKVGENRRQCHIVSKYVYTLLSFPGSSPAFELGEQGYTLPVVLPYCRCPLASCQLSKLNHRIRLPCPRALPRGTGGRLGTRLGIWSYLPCSRALPRGIGESPGGRLGIGPYSVRVYMYVKFMELKMMHSLGYLLPVLTGSWGHVWEDSHGDRSCRDGSEQGEREETTRRGECFGVKATSHHSLPIKCCVCYSVLQGLLRYVPIVGSVLSWFSPPTPTTPEGRTFSLSSGLWAACVICAQIAV